MVPPAPDASTTITTRLQARADAQEQQLASYTEQLMQLSTQIEGMKKTIDAFPATLDMMFQSHLGRQ